jgi:hypothetical protein
MMALFVAVLTASSAFVAVWPLVHSVGAAQVRSTQVEDGTTSTVSRRRQGCRRISIIVRKPGEVTKGCSSARKRPCTPPRRW